MALPAIRRVTKPLWRGKLKKLDRKKLKTRTEIRKEIRPNSITPNNTSPRSWNEFVPVFIKTVSNMRLSPAQKQKLFNLLSYHNN
jgi:hypothetical protein